MKCPHCGQKLEDYEIDLEQYDGRCHERFVCVCSDCGKIWEWENVYEFYRTESPWEVTADDHL